MAVQIAHQRHDDPEQRDVTRCLSVDEYDNNNNNNIGGGAVGHHHQLPTTATTPPRARCFSADAAQRQRLKPSNRSTSFTESLAFAANWMIDPASPNRGDSLFLLDGTSSSSFSRSDSLQNQQQFHIDNNNNNGDELLILTDNINDNNNNTSSSNDDAESTSSSIGYFDSTDFLPTDWEQTMNMLPPVGFAVVASGFILFHPLVFIAGALTAFGTFGTFRAVTAGIDCCVDGTLWKVFDETNNNDHQQQLYTTTTTQQQKQMQQQNQHQLQHHQTNLDGQHQQQIEVSAVDAGRNMANNNNKNKKTPELLTLSDVTFETTTFDVAEGGSSCHAGGTTTSTSTTEVIESKEQNSTTTTSTTTPSTNEDLSSSILRSDPSSFKETSDALEWVQHYYPPLANSAVEKVAFNNLNAIEFFNVFYANDAPYSFQELQKKRQDKDIQYGLWEDLEHVRQPSLHTDAISCINNFDISKGFKERILNFEAKTNSYFGPPYASTTKVQRGLVASKRLVVLESKTTVANIPFGHCFHVMERWVIVSEKDSISKRYISYLSVCSEVFFTKSCPFEGQIRSKSKETILEIAKSWTTMAHEALKLTEQHRLKRLNNLQRSGFGSDLSSLINEPSSNGGQNNNHSSSSCPITTTMDDPITNTNNNTNTPSRNNYNENDDALDESIEVHRLGYCSSFVLGEGGEENDDKLITNEESSSSSSSVRVRGGNRRRTSSIEKIGKKARDLKRYFSPNRSHSS